MNISTFNVYIYKKYKLVSLNFCAKFRCNSVKLEYRITTPNALTSSNISIYNFGGHSVASFVLISDVVNLNTWALKPQKQNKEGGR